MLKGKVLSNRAPVFICALLVFITMTALWMRGGNASISPLPAGGGEVSAPAQIGSAGSFAPVIRVWLHPDDIYPDVVRVKPGKVLLMAENQKATGISLIIEKVLANQSKQAIASISASDIARRAGNVLDLSPGEYIFYDQSRPDLTGAIIVGNQ